MLADCKRGDAEQIFKLPAHDSGQIQWQKMPEMCLDLKGGSTLDGTSILLWRCKENKFYQQWDLAFLAEGRASAACTVALTPATRATTPRLQENHNCKEDYVHRALVWSDAKSRWCCKTAKVGCAGQSASGWNPFSASQRSTAMVERKSLRLMRHSNSSSSRQTNDDDGYWSQLPSDGQLVRPLSGKFMFWRMSHMGRQAMPLLLLAGLAGFCMVSVAALATGRCQPVREVTLHGRMKSFCSRARLRGALYKPVSLSEAASRRGLLSTSAFSDSQEN